MSKYTTGSGHFAREVRDAENNGVAWCGQSDGEAMAKRIARALNAEAENADLRARLKAAREFRDLPPMRQHREALDAITDLRNKSWRKARGEGR